MIKAKSGKTVILGIDSENIKRLQEGNAILVKGESLQIDYNIIIAYGETLDDVARELNLPKIQ